jgi:ATP-dependent DNA helicase RecQ
VSDLLNNEGIAATFYHAGLDTMVKDERQKAWQQDKVRVMVATNAFGMGIDKPDVRLVIHIDCPDSIEAYFQEAGRAGRDGKKAYAVLLYNDNDKRKLLKRISDTFPEKDYVRKVYDHLSYYYQVATGSGYNATFEFNIDDFCHKFRHFPIQVHSALKILNRAGYIEYIEEQENQARVLFRLTRDQLYRLENTEPNEERIITALLRNYGGLFTDYVFIDEGLIAHETGMTQPMVYQTLKLLGQKHIINFIPQKRTPYVRYMQRREDSEYLMFSPAVYDDLRQRYTNRIHAMIDYVQTANECRSRQLLRYFGEKNDHDCGQCDVCMSYKRQLTDNGKTQSASQLILDLLADGQQHHVTELRQLPLPYEQIDAALGQLMLEEDVYMDGAYLTKAK